MKSSVKYVFVFIILHHNRVIMISLLKIHKIMGFLYTAGPNRC